MNEASEQSGSPAPENVQVRENPEAGAGLAVGENPATDAAAPDPAAAGSAAAAAGRPEPPLPSGCDRRTWEDWADELLLAVRPFFSPGRARLVLPGPVGGYGVDSDALEGFARTFLLAGFRLAGAVDEQGAAPPAAPGSRPSTRAADEDGTGPCAVDPLDLADWYRAGLIAGTTPGGPEAWPTLPELGQAKVEAASIALVLDMTRPLIWDRLSPDVQANVIAWLAPAVGDRSYPPCNWLWFQIVVETFLRSVGGPWSEEDIRSDLALLDSFYVGDGWFSDGPERGFDYYVGWAMHLYPVLWARMRGAEDLAAGRREADAARLGQYLEDFLCLIGADGAPLFQGRSLIYRFAAAAPLWAGAIAGAPGLDPGVARRAASLVVEHFRSHGAPNAQGLLDIGWFGPWEGLRQFYSGSSSPYWAAKGFLGLALPPDHPVWRAEEAPLPIERGDVLRAIAAPGWIVSGTREDGVVRVLNHGTDHARPGDAVADAPLYARLGYSTVTTPCLDAASELDPLDMSVALIDARGRASHRAGMEALGVAVEDGVGRGASRGEAHWVDPDAHQQGHGSGATGRSERAGELVVVSLVRGPWELRAHRVADPAPAAREVRVGGWAVTGERTPFRTDERTACAVADGLVSELVLLRGTALDRPAVECREDASPLPGSTGIPFLRLALEPGTWQAVAVGLRREGDGARKDWAPRPLRLLEITETPDALRVEVLWGDGEETVTLVPLVPSA